MKTILLSLSWSVSRGSDTYGYNICRLDDSSTYKRYRCNGGGYDMIGTVFGDWLADVHQDKLKLLNPKQFYGLHPSPEGALNIVGACGIDCMTDIAKAIGLKVQPFRNKHHRLIGYLIIEDEEVC